MQAHQLNVACSHWFGKSQAAMFKAWRSYSREMAVLLEEVTSARDKQLRYNTGTTVDVFKTHPQLLFQVFLNPALQI
jgi:hypothetical protein